MQNDTLLSMKYTVLLFYKYVTIVDPVTVAARLRSLATEHALTGRAIVASEGINVTLEGESKFTKYFLNDFLKDTRFADMLIKRSEGNGKAFPKLSVKVRNEIVGTRFPQEMADPRRKAAPHVTADELRAMYERNDDFVVVDMRNDYEYRVGHFANSINPGLESSRDLPQALPKLEPLKKKKVVTVCTGGIRCEKMSAYLQSNGFEDVYQLENGMHGYMEKFPGKDFEGSLYTFDRRVTIDFGGDKNVIGTCELCGTASEQFVNCANDLCHRHFIACSECQSSNTAACSESCALLSKSQGNQKLVQSITLDRPHATLL